MSLITRILPPDNKNAKLTFAEMDSNLYYLQSLGVSGITFSSSTLTLTNPTGGTKTVTINDYYTTGATYSNGLIYFNRNDQLSAYTVNISSLTGDANTFITAVTYTSSANTITLTDNTNSSFSVYINSVSGLTVNGSLSATTLYGDGSNLTGISTQDTFVTGGTYSNGSAIFTNNTGGTFNVSGFYTGGTDVFVTGGTYSLSTLTFTNNTGGTFNVTGITTATNFSNTLFVDPNGNDSTAVKGDIFKPYANLYAAKSAATSGDTIYVFPGTWSYDNRNTAGNPYNGQIDTLVNLWKDGVNYYFSPNSKIIFYNQTVTGNDMYLFKSPGSGGTCTVRGYLEFSGDSIGSDTGGGAVVFYDAGIGDGCIFDCEVNTLISRSQLMNPRGNTITGQTSTIRIVANEISYTHTGNNVGQSGAGAPIVIRSTTDAIYNLKFKKAKSTYYQLIQMWSLTSATTVTVDIDYGESLGNDNALYTVFCSSPNIFLNIKKLDYRGRAYLSYLNGSTYKLIGNINFFEVQDGSPVERFYSFSSSQGTSIFNGTFNFLYNRILFHNQTTEKMFINGDINVNTANFTNLIFYNRNASGEINFEGNINGNFQGVVARTRAGKTTIKNSSILPSITGGTFIGNDTTTTGNTIVTNTRSIFNSSSNLINGQYLNNYILNSQIKNSGTGNIFVNTTTTGTLQLHNSTLVSTSGSTINITGVAPLTTSNSTSNTSISAPTINGSMTILTELDLL